MSSTTMRPGRSHLRPTDVLRLAGTGLRARPMRAFLLSSNPWAPTCSLSPRAPT